ncbi:MAG: hypothetical protein KDK70_17880 [Myxococcales bacterium]|nr:hypothetical protein [Myxococcales bacterium]
MVIVPTPAVFAGMFVLSVCGWVLVLRTVVAPRLAGLARLERLTVLALPGCFRHVSAVLLVPGVAGPGLPGPFVGSLVVGDVLTAVLAMGAVVALRRGAAGAVALTWGFNVVGLADLLKNLIHGMSLGVADHFGAAAFVPTMVVPLMLCVHVWSLVELSRRA